MYARKNERRRKGIGDLNSGYLDVATCDRFAGWAWIPGTPNLPVNVDILDNGTVIGTALANSNRPDLVSVINSPNHGFDVTAPSRLKDGQAHVIRARIRETGQLLDGGAGFSCAAAAAAGNPPVVGSSAPPAGIPKWALVAAAAAGAWFFLKR